MIRSRRKCTGKSLHLCILKFTRVSAQIKFKGGWDAMKEQMKELQKLKGIGEVLSRRLVESSYDTIAKDEEVQS